MTLIQSLTRGAITRIMQGEYILNPVVQILNIDRVNPTKPDEEQYRLIISDGEYHCYAMLDIQLNQLHHYGLLSENTIVCLDKYTISMAGKKGFGNNQSIIFRLILNELTALNSGDQVQTKIGEPVTYENADTANSASTAPVLRGPEERKQSNNNYNSNDRTLKTKCNALTIPIASLSPFQKKWFIKARVVGKTRKYPYRGGRYFSMNLKDKSGEIRVTAYKEQCDKFYDLIVADNVYFFSNCHLKLANKQYSLKSDYEMSFTGETMVQLCDDEDNVGVPEIKFDLIPLSQVTNMENNESVDTIGICKEVGELQTVTSRTTNKELKKRELTLVDASNDPIVLVLWNNEAINFDGQVKSVILVKGSRIKEYLGHKNLNVGSGSILKINPDTPEAHKLREWFDNGGGNNISTMVSARTGGGSFSTDWLTLKDAYLRNLGSGEKPDYFQCKAVVYIVKQDNAFYKACPQADCNKKVMDEGNGHYRCERCNAAYPNFKYFLKVDIHIGDCTFNRRAICFGQTGEQLLKHTTQEIVEALENDPARAQKIFSDVKFSSHIFKLRCMNTFYEGTVRNMLYVQSINPLNIKEYNGRLIKELIEMTNGTA
ncbi:replication protein A 70 kDa DNA-binding subunit-like [Drosophila hydei]|uniref:Replication protein A subunit n=1 Tax=Drosophila hydei TaxID=7224 RepID=A0A6J1ME28_DROHY|nr:replication protein A 70 kDa DNA-binding subunit-like [Drosophila hydei]